MFDRRALRQLRPDLTRTVRAGTVGFGAIMLTGLLALSLDLSTPDRFDPAVRWLPVAQQHLLIDVAAVTAAALGLLAASGMVAFRRQAEQAAASRLDAVMAATVDGMALFDGSLRCLRLNQTFAALVAGRDSARATVADLTGLALADLLPDEWPRLEASAAAVFRGAGRMDGGALSRPQANGAPREWALSLSPVPAGMRGTIVLGLTAREVTAQRAVERRLSFQLEVEERLRDLSDPLAMKNCVCELVARQLGAAQSSYAELETPYDQIVVDGGWTDGRVAETAGRRLIADYDQALLLELRQTRCVTVADVMRDPRIGEAQRSALAGSRGIAAFAMVMLEHQGNPSGILLVSDAAPRQWSDSDVALLRDAADRSWNAIARGRATEAVRESEQRFQRAVAGAGIGIWDWDLGSNVVSISRGFLPQVHENLQGATCTDAEFLAAIHPDDRSRMAAVLERVAAQGQSGENFFYEAEYRTVSRRGNERWLRSQGRVTERSPLGHATRLSGVTVDVTSRRRAEDALNAAQERLRLLNQDLAAQVSREVAAREQAQSRLAQTQRLEALAQLAAGIAHDFNNVLQAITGSLALVQRRAGDAEVVRQLAGMAGDAAARGSVITARLLSFARQGELQPSPVAPAPLLHGLQDMFEHMLGARIRLHLDVDEALPPLFADKAQLEAVLVNLALNARDAMPDGGELRLGARRQSVAETDVTRLGLPPGDFVRIDMTDTGMGMNAAVLARASEPFFTTKPPGQGTGLGLAMARGFAEQSGGAFLLASTPGEGTTVSIWLPLAPTAGAADSMAASPTSDADPQTPRTRAGPLARLLLVDDDALVREVLAGQIEDLGYRVSRANSGPAALARLDAGETPDILITDYAMPGMNGAVLLAEARRRLPRLPVVLLTGFADQSLRLDMQEWDAGITMLLRKPVSSDTLAKAASAVLHGARDIVSQVAEDEVNPCQK